jgi:putative acid phosphatase of HAD superfamily subfamily IIIB
MAMQLPRGLPAALLAALALAAPAAADTPVTTVRPTGVGLPIIGTGQDVQAGDTPAMVARLRDYHDSGQLARDRRQVARAARRSLLAQLAALPAGARPAIVLDIDETSLSNWLTLDAGDFGGRPVPETLASRPDPAIAPTLRIYRLARARHVAVFFVTGRSPSARTFTQRNLRSVGYRAWTGAFFRPSNRQTIPFKSGTRATIERRGYTILINVGDQQSDLQGGHAVAAFKYPNPFYFIG